MFLILPSLSAVAGLGQELHSLFRLEKGCQTLTDNGVVIRQNNFYRHSLHPTCIGVTVPLPDTQEETLEITIPPTHSPPPAHLVLR